MIFATPANPHRPQGYLPVLFLSCARDCEAESELLSATGNETRQPVLFPQIHSQMSNIARISRVSLSSSFIAIGHQSESEQSHRV